MSPKFGRSAVATALALLLAFSTIIFAQRANSPVQFSFRSIDGTTVTNAEVHGQVVVLAFGASWLPLSKKLAQGIRKTANDYSAHGVIVYWVSTDSESPRSRNYASDDQLRAFAKKNDLTLTVLRDPDGKISKQFGVDQIPAIVILDRQGHVYGEPMNGLDPDLDLGNELAKPLDSVLGLDH